MSQDAGFEQAASKFLENDFNQCFAQMRHYDSQIFAATKFSLAAYTALIGAAFTLYKFSNDNANSTVDLTPVAIAILTVGLAFGLLMLAFVARNRAYYVYVARYINEHRRFFLARKPLGFPNQTGMYMSLDKPQFLNWRSSQAYHLYLLSFLNSMLAAALLLLAFIPCYPTWAATIAIVGFILSLQAQLVAAIWFLCSREKKPADHGVFGKPPDSNLHLE